MSSSKHPRKRKPAASPGVDSPQASALPDEPRGDEAASALDRALERGTATFADELRRMRQDVAQRYITQTLEPVVEPPVERTPSAPKAPLGSSQLGEPLAAPATPPDASGALQKELQAAADTAPPGAKRGRGKRAPRSAATPPAKAPQGNSQLGEPLAAPAAPPDAPAARQNEPQAAADTPLPTPPPVAEHGDINSGATHAPARAKRAPRSAATPPAKAPQGNSQLGEPLAAPAALPDAPAARQNELRASIYIPSARPPVAQGDYIRSDTADAPAQVKAAPPSEATRPDPAHTITARSTNMLSLSSIRERFPWANDATVVFALTIIFLLGLLLGFLLLEGKGQAFDASTPASQPVASDTDARPNVAPASQPATAEPSIEQRPVDALVPTSVSTRPTIVPTPSRPEPTALPSAAELVQRVATAEQTLRAGAIEATLDYSNGSSASAQLRFDVGSTEQKPRFWMRSTYNSASGSQVVERITIGDKGWERQPDGHWLAGRPQDAITDQLRVFLPQSDQITQAEQSGDSDATTLHWYDASRNADVTLTIDQATGIPRQLRRIGREGGVKLVVAYTQWNTPIDITAPPEG